MPIIVGCAQLRKIFLLRALVRKYAVVSLSLFAKIAEAAGQTLLPAPDASALVLSPTLTKQKEKPIELPTSNIFPGLVDSSKALCYRRRGEFNFLCEAEGFQVKGVGHRVR